MVGKVTRVVMALCGALGFFTTGCQWVSDSTEVDGGDGVSRVDAGSASATPDGPGTSPCDSGTAPVDASTLDAGPAIGIAAGGQHSCAVTSTGSVWCWGSNAKSQLGVVGCEATLVPVEVPQARPAAAVTAGDEHTCALSLDDAGSEVHCWGADSHGQLGVAGIAMTPVAVPVAGLGSNVTAIAAGGLHTCAIASGDVWCWGDDADGQLGNGATVDSATPVRVSSLPGVAAIATGGAHTCALTSGGGVECWGLNAYGQVGDGTTTSRAAPVSVLGLGSGVAAIAAGNDHTCALTAAGRVECWGFGFYGQLGNGGIASSSTPVVVSGLPQASIAIATGGTHSCALAASGAMWCWGDDQSGQLGDGESTDSLMPAAVVGLAPGATSIVAGTAHTCALFSGGGAECWGWNVAGQLGCDTSSDSPLPVAICGL